MTGDYRALSYIGLMFLIILHGFELLARKPETLFLLCDWDALEHFKVLGSGGGI